MEILYSGSYVLLLEEVGAPRLQVAGGSWRCLTRVEKKRTWLVWCGLVMLLVGAAIMVRDLVMHTLKK